MSSNGIKLLKTTQTNKKKVCYNKAQWGCSETKFSNTQLSTSTNQILIKSQAMYKK